jgi:hypothetical protein
MQPRPDRTGGDPELAGDLFDAETHYRVQDHGLSRPPRELLQGLDNVEVICIRRLTVFGDSHLTVALLKKAATPAVGGEVPHHTPAPGLRMVVLRDNWPVLPYSNEHFLNEILRILSITGE